MDTTYEPGIVPRSLGADFSPSAGVGTKQTANQPPPAPHETAYLATSGKSVRGSVNANCGAPTPSLPSPYLSRCTLWPPIRGGRGNLRSRRAMLFGAAAIIS